MPVGRAHRRRRCRRGRRRGWRGPARHRPPRRRRPPRGTTTPRVMASSVSATRSPGSRAPAMRPPAPWSLSSLRTLKLRSIRPRVAATAGDAEGDGVGAHRQPADGGDVVGQHGEEGVGDEQHPVGAARRLLGVDEPVAALAGPQRELAPSHGVGEQVLDERRRRSTRHSGGPRRPRSAARAGRRPGWRGCRRRGRWSAR